MVRIVEGTTPAPEGDERVQIGIDGDTIVEPDGSEPDRVFDEGYLLPAAIDMHVHFREPGDTHKESIATGTRSAAYGGVGLAVDMPNTSPPTDTREAYEAKVRRVEASAHVDVGLWGGVSHDMSCFELGDEAIGYKLYAGPTTGELLIDDPDKWKEAVEQAADTSRPLAVHAEHPTILAEARADEDPPATIRDHNRLRPAEAEVRVIELLAHRADEAGAHLHAAHASDPRTVDAIERYEMTCEVTPHHALLDTDRADDQGALTKVNPPIRSAATREKMHKALYEGRIDAVASDHAPHTRDEKTQAFDDAPSGLPGVETLFPLMLAEAVRGHLPFDRVLDTCCRGPADILDVPAGRIEPGAWANLVHVPDDTVELALEDTHSKCGWTPYEGFEAVLPDALMVRGEWVLDERELVAKPGDGRFVGGPAWD